MRLLVISSEKISEDRAQSIVTHALKLDLGIPHTWKVKRYPQRLCESITKFEPDTLVFITPSANDIALAMEIKTRMQQPSSVLFIGFNGKDQFSAELEKFEQETSVQRIHLHFH